MFLCSHISSHLYNSKFAQIEGFLLFVRIKREAPAATPHMKISSNNHLEAVRFRVPSKGTRFPLNAISMGKEPGTLTGYNKSSSLQVLCSTYRIRICRSWNYAEFEQNSKSLDIHPILWGRKKPHFCKNAGKAHPQNKNSWKREAAHTSCSSNMLWG